MSVPAGAPVLSARGLSKVYGTGEGRVRAVDAVELDVDAGETVAIMGPSGCGKSTLLHLFGGLDRPSDGEVLLNGRRVDDLGERALARMRQREIGYVFQSFHLLEELTAVENVELSALLAGRSPRAARRRALELLDRLGLAERSGFLPTALSGGQRQRVAVARALCNEPTVVLADEPTGNLDSAATLDVLRLFRDLHESGQTLVVVTHDARIAATADRMLSMRDGAFVDETRLTGGTGGLLGALAGLGGLIGMGRSFLVVRLALRDLRHRRTEAALPLVAVLAATTTLTLGLVVREAAADPYASTRAATEGPDVVASVADAADPAALETLADAPGVTGTSGPYPVVAGELQASGRTADVQVVGRDAAAAAVDQPAVTQGSWVRDDGVVVEAAFAAELGLDVGDPVSLGGKTFQVVGIAVTAAMAPYPGSSCLVSTGCINGAVPDGRDLPAGLLHDPGLVWLTRADVQSLASGGSPLSSVMNLRLADPDEAQAFVDRNGSDAVVMQTWQSILADATEVAHDSQILLLIGAWLLGLLAVASLSLLVGGRMADQTRRVGLLKTVGGTPGLVAAVLLAEYVVVAVVAAAAGLAIGALTAPLLTGSSAGLVGSAGAASLSRPTIGLVTLAALGVAVLSSVVPAVRAARTSTVDALADAAHPPRRTGWLIAVSTRVPVPLLLALRVAARRPRRAVLAVVSVAVTVSGIYVLLVLSSFLGSQAAAAGYTEGQVETLRHVLLVWTVVLLCLAAVNTVVVTWATVLDNRHTSALARALGATPGGVTVALAAAQVLPALLGAVLGIFPGGWVLFAGINAVTGGDSGRASLPAPWQLAVVVAATVLVVAALTAVPARVGARRPVVDAL